MRVEVYSNDVRPRHSNKGRGHKEKGLSPTGTSKRPFHDSPDYLETTYVFVVFSAPLPPKSTSMEGLRLRGYSVTRPYFP